MTSFSTRKCVIVVIILCSCCIVPNSTKANNVFSPKKHRPQRLPSDFVPESYKLEVSTYLKDDDENYSFQFSGRVWIKIRCQNETNKLTLHARHLSIIGSQLTLHELPFVSSDRRSIEVRKVELDTLNDFLIVHLNETLMCQSSYELYIEFKAPLGEKRTGYYRLKYFDTKSNKTLWMTVTQFEPIHARSAFPCFDEPALKATFDIALGHKTQYTALSNMPLRKSIQNTTNDWLWDHFETSVPMSTYLVAYSISQFVHLESGPHAINAVTVRVWSRPDYIEQVNYALWLAPRALEFFEQYFNLAYPMTKLDLIAIPNLSAAGMENYGLITFSEESLLHSIGKSSMLRKQLVASVVTHEVAHMWFGNLVTVQWWSDIWLNEGLSTYMGIMCVQFMHPEWDYEHISSMQNILISLRSDGRSTSRAISGAEHLSTLEEIDNQFDGGAYEKGSTLVRMLHRVLGEEAFRDGIQKYLRTHQYRNVVQDDFIQSLQSGRRSSTTSSGDGLIGSNGIPLTEIMNTWLLQPGYPIIYVHRNYTNKSVSITQRRYFNFKDIEPEPSTNDDDDDNENDVVVAHKQQKQQHPCWWIPLSYISHPTTASNATTSATSTITTTTTAITSTNTTNLDQSKSPKTTTPNWLKCDNRNVSFAPNTTTTTTTSTTEFTSAACVYRHPDEASPTEWVLHNIEMVGLYRVRYDTHNWMLLIEHLAGPHFRRISPINRAQLIDDAMSEAWFGKLSYGRTMRLMAYLSQEDDYVPWSMALDNLDMLNTELDGTVLHELFKDFMRAILTPIYRKVGGLSWNADSFEMNIHLKTLIIMYGYQYGVDDCQQQAVAYFQNWMSSRRDADTINRIPIDLRLTVYCVALKLRGPSEMDFILERYAHSVSVHERYDILEAIGCATQQRHFGGETIVRSLLKIGAVRRRSMWDGSKIVFERRSGTHQILADSDIIEHTMNNTERLIENNGTYINRSASKILRENHNIWFQRFQREAENFLKTFRSA